MLSIGEYQRLRERPPEPRVMYQRWRSLLFLHFACEPEEVARLLPPGVEVDTFEGKAWVGLVPFRMEGVRPRFLPGIPGTTAFPETNVRTYVHREGREPGVWFFSLDAASALACFVARLTFGLPYFESNMTIHEEGILRVYDSVRRAGGVESHVTAHIGEPLPEAEPGSLEFFLVERYLLYALRRGTLLKGRVFHRPYPLLKVREFTVDDRLIQAAGLKSQPFHHALFSPGVDVDIHAPS